MLFDITVFNKEVVDFLNSVVDELERKMMLDIDGDNSEFKDKINNTIDKIKNNIDVLSDRVENGSFYINMEAHGISPKMAFHLNTVFLAVYRAHRYWDKNPDKAEKWCEAARYAMACYGRAKTKNSFKEGIKMQNKETFSIADFFEMVRNINIVEIDAKNIHEIQIIERDAKKQMRIFNYMNRYSVKSTRNENGFVIDIAQQTSPVARAMIERILRIHGDRARLTQSHDEMTNARFARDFDATDISTARIKTFREVESKRAAALARVYADKTFC